MTAFPARPAVALDAVVDALPVGIAVFDAGRRLVRANHAFCVAADLPPAGLPVGIALETVLRAGAYRGLLGSGDPEAQVHSALARDRAQPSRVRQHYPDARSFDFHTVPLPDGGFALCAIETTTLIAAHDEAAGAVARITMSLATVRTGLATFAPERTLLLHNPRFAELLGLPLGKLRPGLTLADLLGLMQGRHEYADAEGEAFLANQASTDRTRRSTIRRARPNGQVTDIASDPLPDGGWTMSVVDISQLASAEDEAVRRAAMLDSILDNIPHGVCVYGPNRQVTMFNPAYSEIMQGAPLAVGDHLDAIIRRRAQAGEYGPGQPAEVYTSQMAHDISRPQMRRRRRPNGTAIDVRTAPLPDGGHISVVTDITPLTDAENELLRRAADMDVMLANIRHGITLFDAGGRLVAANRMASELLDLPPGTLTPGHSEQQILDSLAAAGEFGDGAAAEAFMRHRLSANRAGKPELYRRPTSAGRVIEVRSDPAPGGGTVLTYTDVTESEETQKELRRAKEAAEAANQAKSRFLATMSHELRTPLNAVIGFSEALLRQGGTSDPALTAEFAAAINESGNQLLGLINTILDVARIEAGRFEMSADRIDLARLVQTCARSVASGFQAGEIALRLDLPERLPELRADERRLQQVLAGLLSNAVKFTPAGGEVTVGATIDPTGDLLLHVTDTGIGIPAADLERVFEPFIQLDASLSRRFQGAGLGLYVARALVEAHGGRLRLLSEPGAGTRAEIALPGWRLDPERSSRENSSVDEDVA